MKRVAVIASIIVVAGFLAIGGAFAQKAGGVGSIPIKGGDEAVLAGMAKIPIDSAVSEALKAVPGKVVKAELENEDGYLVYGIEIAKADRQIADVKVDAGNGKVMKIDTDRKDRDGHEKEKSENDHEEADEE
ncbi:MAG: Peptidase propeptide and YPEB domain protein [Syntrophorhabdus sp. PtaU1.Bin058]|nr:MAG: Peptidase propeptide and YPEB domain protein [Syntrophorhabdus sp. PtaU1.Bin058]